MIRGWHSKEPNLLARWYEVFAQLIWGCYKKNKWFEDVFKRTRSLYDSVAKLCWIDRKLLWKQYEVVTKIIADCSWNIRRCIDVFAFFHHENQDFTEVCTINFVASLTQELWVSCSSRCFPLCSSGSALCWFWWSRRLWPTAHMGRFGPFRTVPICRGNSEPIVKRSNWLFQSYRFQVSL